MVRRPWLRKALLLAGPPMGKSPGPGFFLAPRALAARGVEEGVPAVFFFVVAFDFAGGVVERAPSPSVTMPGEW